ncbi:MAG: flagellar filament capping protein FliD [Vampirovibrionales bacterium]|jgi:flagellar hook-associated protein 2|nr:flagellar filament capping protein FliD [Vampirovibrionales bacterium]
MMGITFGGISSGLPVNQIIDATIASERRPLDAIQTRIDKTNSQKSTLATITSRAKTFQTALKVLTSTSILDANIFQARKATSSNTDALEVTASAGANLASLAVKVNTLATATTARSTAKPGASATSSTLLSSIKNMSMTSGTFSVYVNGVASSVSVDATTDTFGDVLGRIGAISGVSSATINADGQLVVNATTGGTVQFGSTGDTSNFLKLSKLDTTLEAGSTFTANQFFSTVDTTQNVSTGAAGLNTPVTAGSTFKLGKATFDTTGKSIAQLMNDINNSADSGVSAVFNSLSNRLELTSKSTGQVGIQMEDVTGNFLTAMNVISAGNSLASQTLGTNAKVTVNGTEYLSTSNEVGEAQTGLKGITLKLKQVKTDADINVLVDQDTSKLTKAIDDVVTAFNTMIGTIDTETKADTGKLGAQNSVRSFRTQIRQTMTAGTTGQVTYNSLGQIGISTASSNGQSANSTLTFDSAKFITALKASPDDVESLIKGATGVFTKLQTIVDNAVKTGSGTSDKGVFQSISDSYDSFITRSKKNITDGEARLEKRRTRLQQQYAASDSLISQYKSQGNALSAIGNQRTQ